MSSRSEDPPRLARSLLRTVRNGCDIVGQGQGRLSPIGRLSARSRRLMVIEVPDHVTPLA